MQSISIAALLGDDYAGLEDNELIEKLTLEVLALRAQLKDANVKPLPHIPWYPQGVREPLKPLERESFRPRIISTN